MEVKKNVGMKASLKKGIKETRRDISNGSKQE